jgi:hypothetical protein
MIAAAGIFKIRLEIQIMKSYAHEARRFSLNMDLAIAMPIRSILLLFNDLLWHVLKIQ